MKALCSKKVIALLSVMLVAACCGLAGIPQAAKAVPLPETRSITVEGNWLPGDEAPGFEIELKQYTGESWDYGFVPEVLSDGSRAYYELYPVNNHPYNLRVSKTGYYDLYKQIILTDRDLTVPVELISLKDPNGLYFADNESTTGKISGELYWSKPEEEDAAFTHYYLFFTDDNGDRLPGVTPVAVQAKLDSTNNYPVDTYFASIPSTTIPAGASQLRIFKADGAEAAIFQKTGAFVTLLDFPDEYPNGVTLVDTDKDAGMVNATFAWNKNPNESKISHYVIKEDSMFAPRILALIAPNGSQNYSYTHTYDLSDEVPILTLTTLNKNGEEPLARYTMNLLDDTSNRTVFQDRVTEVSAPYDISFERWTGLDPTKLSGLLRWKYTSIDEEKAFEVYLLNENEEPVKSLFTVYPPYSMYNSDFSVSLPEGIEVPSTATKLGVFLRLGDTEMSYPGTVRINAPLSSLNVKESASNQLVPLTVFADNHNYSGIVSNSVDSITVTAAAENPGSTVKINNLPGNTATVNLNVGYNFIPITVTLTEGTGTTINQYYLNVTRSMSGTNAALSQLSVKENSTGQPVFLNLSSDLHTYSGTVANSVYSINVAAVTQDLHAAVTINGLHGKTGDVNLNEGLNTIPVNVTAENGTTVNHYSLHITRNAPLFNDTQLNSLSLGGGYSLTPSFSKDIPGYMTFVDSQATSISVSASVYSGSNGWVRINNGQEKKSVTDTVYLSGLTTVVPITIEAPGKAPGNYSITVVKPGILSSGSGAVKGNRLEGVPAGTTAGALLNGLQLPSGITAKVVNGTNNATVNDDVPVDSSMKVVASGSSYSASYEIKTLTDMLHSLLGTAPGQKLQVDQILQFINQPNKVDLTGDAIFNAKDVRKVLLEITPVK